MGYDLHITRRDNWTDQGHDITSDEWLKLVAADPELTLDSQNGPYFAVWRGASKLPQPWLDWSDGQIYTKNPDRGLMAKMLTLARQLSATVQGDDGEEYTRLEDFPDETAGATPRQPKGYIYVLLCISLVSFAFIFIARDWKDRMVFIAGALLAGSGAYWLIKQLR